MILKLSDEERVIWQGRPAYPFYGPIVAIVSLAVVSLLIALDLQVQMRIVFAFFFGLLILFSIYSVLDIFSSRALRYYLTNLRVARERVSDSKIEEILLEQLRKVSAEQGFLNRIRGIGLVCFEQEAGKQIVFSQVKNPEEVREKTLNAKGMA